MDVNVINGKLGKEAIVTVPDGETMLVEEALDQAGKKFDPETQMLICVSGGLAAIADLDDGIVEGDTHIVILPKLE